MAEHVLGVDTVSDDLTQACLDAREARVYPQLADRGLDVVRLTGEEVTPASLAAALTGTAVPIGLLTLCGHGLPDQVLGQGGPVLAIGQYPPEAVRGKIVHLLACSSGDQLGPDMVANGCRAFFGYREEFMFPAAKARDFLDCDAVIDTGFADGLSADEVFQLAIRFFNKRINELKDAGEHFRSSLLQHNRDCLCAPTVDTRWGDPGATL